MEKSSVIEEYDPPSTMPVEVEPTKLMADVERQTNGAAAALGPGSFTMFFTWRGNGVVPRLRFNHPSITARSRVFVSLSEFSSDAQINRFIGDAKMDVYNVAPFNGGFHAWVEVAWSHPLPVRFDVLVDP